MTGYRIERDDADDILICRISDFIEDQAAEALAQEWRSAVEGYLRSHKVLRILFDNSGGFVMSPKTAARIAEATRGMQKADDRAAVLAPNSLAKMQAKRTMSAGGEVFVSEKAARMWLTAGA